jgi:hypothetical protein
MSNKSKLDKIKDFFGFKLPSMEISPEREDEIIEKVVESVSKYGFVLPSLIVSHMLYPVSTLLVHTAILPAVPIIEFLGLNAYEYAAFLNKKENVKRIMDRLEELKIETDAKRTSFWDPGT